MKRPAQGSAFATARHEAAAPEAERCRVCGSRLSYETDGMGHVRARCESCARARAPRLVLAPRTPTRAELIELVAREFGVPAADVERRLRCMTAIQWQAELRRRARPTTVTCPDCGIQVTVPRIGLIPRRCRRCTAGRAVRRWRAANPDRVAEQARARYERRRAGRGTHAARVYRAKPCVRCGATFQPTGPRALYCSPSCLALGWRVG